ncbi:MAG: hypothetical protein GXO10_01550 [Crenarchaeota archaeon]|nr:hypothetical protein [Thermoproteota archaeon]
MVTEVIYSEETVLDMLRKLENDLLKGNIILVERLPPVRETEKYRDHIANILREFHKAFILIRIVFADGVRRGYAIIISGEGELGEIPQRGIVEGLEVEYMGDKKRKIVYRPVAFTSPQELVNNLERFAKLYHESEVRIVELKLPEAYREQTLLYY